MPWTRPGRIVRGLGPARLARALFATAVVLLIALSAWWIVLLQRSVAIEAQLLRQALADAAVVHAAHIKLAGALPPWGPLSGDPRFEVVAEAGGADTIGAALDGQHHLRASAVTLARLQAQATRRKAMVVGEGVLLGTLLLAVVAMLYRLFRTERRFHDEIEGFLSRVTHDLKTPLAGIKAVLQGIQAGLVAPDQVPALAARALREVEREESLIQNILLAQRVRQGHAVARQAIDVAALLQAVVDGRDDLPSGVPISLDRAPDMGLAWGDAAAIRSIFDNLLDNAVKYGAKAVAIVARATPGFVEVEVRDDGEGFAPEAAARLFAPFVREPGGARRRGTGLGLWIARSLAEAMGGTLRGTSPGPGQGATFVLSLRAAPPGAPGAPGHAEGRA